MNVLKKGLTYTLAGLMAAMPITINSEVTAQANKENSTANQIYVNHNAKINIGNGPFTYNEYKSKGWTDEQMQKDSRFGEFYKQHDFWGDNWLWITGAGLLIVGGAIAILASGKKEETKQPTTNPTQNPTPVYTATPIPTPNPNGNDPKQPNSLGPAKSVVPKNNLESRLSPFEVRILAPVGPNLLVDLKAYRETKENYGGSLKITMPIDYNGILNK